MKKLIFLFFIIIISSSCKKSNYADLIIYNGIIYTVDSLNNIVESISDSNCDDDDVIILLDGDDWLASSYTLDILSSEYRSIIY